MKTLCDLFFSTLCRNIDMWQQIHESTHLSWSNAQHNANKSVNYLLFEWSDWVCIGWKLKVQLTLNPKQIDRWPQKCVRIHGWNAQTQSHICMKRFSLQFIRKVRFATMLHELLLNETHTHTHKENIIQRFPILQKSTMKNTSSGTLVNDDGRYIRESHKSTVRYFTPKIK